MEHSNENPHENRRIREGTGNSIHCNGGVDVDHDSNLPFPFRSLTRALEFYHKKVDAIGSYLKLVGAVAGLAIVYFPIKVLLTQPVDLGKTFILHEVQILSPEQGGQSQFMLHFQKRYICATKFGELQIYIGDAVDEISHLRNADIINWKSTTEHASYLASTDLSEHRISPQDNQRLFLTAQWPTIGKGSKTHKAVGVFTVTTTDCEDGLTHISDPIRSNVFLLQGDR